MRQVPKEELTIVTHSSPASAQYHGNFVQDISATYIREANDVVKVTTPQMSPHKEQKSSGGSRMFRGVSALE